MFNFTDDWLNDDIYILKLFFYLSECNSCWEKTREASSSRVAH